MIDLIDQENRELEELIQEHKRSVAELEDRLSRNVTVKEILQPSAQSLEPRPASAPTTVTKPTLVVAARTAGTGAPEPLNAQADIREAILWVLRQRGRSNRPTITKEVQHLLGPDRTSEQIRGVLLRARDSGLVEQTGKPRAYFYELTPAGRASK